MDSHNTEAEEVVSEESVELMSDSANVRVLSWDRVGPDGLSIADDPNPGVDPYNSTGQHVIIKSRINLED